MSGAYRKCKGGTQKCKGVVQKCKGGLRVLLPPAQKCTGQYGSVRVGYREYGRLHVEASLGY